MLVDLRCPKAPAIDHIAPPKASVFTTQGVHLLTQENLFDAPDERDKPAAKPAEPTRKLEHSRRPKPNRENRFRNNDGGEWIKHFRDERGRFEDSPDSNGR
jgi:hypothetical protein